MEMWKKIEGFETYQVSSIGQVKSLPNDKTKKEKILKPFYSQGYPKVHLWKEGVRKKRSVHSLVADAFLEKPKQEGLVINHKNGNKADASYQNLEWVTIKENNFHRYHKTTDIKQIYIEKIKRIMLKQGITKDDL
jgi:hypothetical protein